jgi:hypothetical protein
VTLPFLKAAFQYPAIPKSGASPKTAILVRWFARPFRRPDVQVFSEWSEKADAFAPAVIAGTRDQLLALCALTTKHTLTHAVISLTHPGDPLLTPEERNQLWQAFHVPVFEQVIGPRGQLLASECEAHVGLHVSTDPKLAKLLDGLATQDGPCSCGQKSPRIHVTGAVPQPRTNAAHVGSLASAT